MWLCIDNYLFSQQIFLEQLLCSHTVLETRIIMMNKTHPCTHGVHNPARDKRELDHHNVHGNNHNNIFMGPLGKVVMQFGRINKFSQNR